jgi:hypothetical protein
VDTLFARHAPTGSRSVTQELKERGFLEGCLGASTPIPTMCDTILVQDDVKSLLRFAAWSVEQCRLRGLRDESCPRVLKGLAHYCARQRQPTG